MKIENSFEVPAATETAWELLMDVPRVIPCMPGTELTEVVDESTWKAKMTVKLDEHGRRATLSARARELRGRGGGQAAIESTLTPVDGGTRVDIVTELTLSGAVAQYGRGMVEDVSSQLVSRFADCLKGQLTPVAEEPAAVAAQPAPAPAAPLSGLPLLLGALRRALVRLVGRRSS